MIVVYTSKNCIYCHKVKDYLKERGVDYQERSIDNPEYRDELISVSGQMAVPVVNARGEIIVGFSKKRMDEII